VPHEAARRLRLVEARGERGDQFIRADLLVFGHRREFGVAVGAFRLLVEPGHLEFVIAAVAQLADDLRARGGDVEVLDVAPLEVPLELVLGQRLGARGVLAAQRDQDGYQDGEEQEEGPQRAVLLLLLDVVVFVCHRSFVSTRLGVPCSASCAPPARRRGPVS
jgi:hypothetical protein